MRAHAADPDRNYPALFLALDDVLETLGAGRPDEDALQRSFESSADGFGAEKAVLLLVELGGASAAPPRPPARSAGVNPAPLAGAAAAYPLRAVASRGLTPEEVEACERGLSVPGVSSSRIREAMVSRVPVMVQDAERMGKGKSTTALRGRVASVLCAPVCDPRTGEVLAVLYVQNHGVRSAFGEIDRAWIEVYARVLGRVLGAPRRDGTPASEDRAR